MPAIKWSIEPVFLSRKPLPPDKNLYEFEAVANGTMVEVMRQLSALVHASGKIFDELTEECLQLHDRTRLLCVRVSKVEAIASKLNAKRVKIRKCSLLSLFSAIRAALLSMASQICRIFLKNEHQSRSANIMRVRKQDR